MKFYCYLLMKKVYWKYEIMVSDPETQEILVALLSETGFDGFEEQEDILICIGKQSEIDVQESAAILNTRSLSFTIESVEDENWNAIWESNFRPVEVGVFAGVRAHFHPPFTNIQHQIVITPKMSFGTGHHATTWQMMDQMQYLDFKGKKVLDFGTGTGVLAILAEKLGAVSVLAIDNDDWSIDNANENIRVNHCQAIQVRKADDLSNCSGFDIILANINKHILLENATQLRNLVQSGGFLLLSGLLTQDRAEIEKVFGEPPLKLLANYVKNGWIVLIFLHNV